MEIYDQDSCKSGYQVSVDYKTYEIICTEYVDPQSGGKVTLWRRNMLKVPTYAKGTVEPFCPDKGSKRNAKKICKRLV